MNGRAPARLPAARRRAVIEEAAARLFAERGYGGTRLDDVAAAAGVTKPILYRHYPSKKALYLHLLEGHRAAQGESGRAAVASGSLPAHLPQLLDEWFRAVRDHPETWRMIFRDTTGDSEIRAARATVQANARSVIAAVLRDQPDLALPEAEVEPVAELLGGAMAGLALWSLDHPRVSRARLVDLMVRAAGGFLRPSPEGTPVRPRR